VPSLYKVLTEINGHNKKKKKAEIILSNPCFQPFSCLTYPPALSEYPSKRAISKLERAV